MNDDRTSAGTPADVRSSIQKVKRDVRVAFRRRVPRLFMLAHFSLLPNAAVLIAKTALLGIAPSWFLLANVVFASGILATKVTVLVRWRSRRTWTAHDRSRAVRGLYARTGANLAALGCLYIALCLPTVFGERMSGPHDLWAGIAIAAVAFTELIVCIIGLVTGRRDADPAASSLRRLNLCSALVLIVLAQSALLSAITPASQTLNGFTGITVGALVILLGAGPFHRHRNARHDQLQNRPAR